MSECMLSRESKLKRQHCDEAYEALKQWKLARREQTEKEGKQADGDAPYGGH